MPLIASSSGIATVSAITFGFAPGYCARTTTDGGTTSGYSAIGRLLSAIAPARKMRSEMTPAKMGRSMKNLERFMLFFPMSFPRRRESSYDCAIFVGCGATSEPGRTR